MSIASKRSSCPQGLLLRLCVAALLAMFAAGVLATPSAQGAFSFTGFDAEIAATSAGGTYAQAGGHPYAVTTHISIPTEERNMGFGPLDFPVEAAKDILVDTPPGFIGNPTAVEACEFSQLLVTIHSGVTDGPLCPPESQVGTVHARFSSAFLQAWDSPVFRMETPVGAPARFAFLVLGNLVVLDGEVRPPDYRVSVNSLNISTGLALTGVDLTFWGDPAAPSHTAERLCAGTGEFGCVSSAKPTAFLTMPSSCSDQSKGLPFFARGDSWETPGVFATAAFETHLPPGFPLPPESWGAPEGTRNCDVVPFTPAIDDAQPTTDKAQSPSGFNFQLSLPDAGFFNPDGVAQANLKKAVVTLPDGMTINPSQGEGLGICTPSQFEAESAFSDPGAGCPSTSKIGTVRVDTPALDEPLTGSLYVAQQDDPATSLPGAENPFDSMLALYLVARNAERGVIVKLAGKVEPDPNTGQLATTFDDLPQLPFSKFSLSFREGPRSPLVTPPACGTYLTQADLVPWSAADPDNPTPAEIVHAQSTFEVTSGVNGGPCPTGGLPPFHPGLIAGSINNAAGHYSPFNVRLTRNDGEQEITHFSIKLPPGLIGKLAGVPFCPDAAIAAAKTKTGGQELASPSCPAASEVGHTLVGAGVGSVLTYAPGKIYLAGPYNGSALSIAAITAAKVGPFDLGTVVVRQALKVDPETAEVFVDATGSDPIPHIIKGITTHIRDIRAYVDKPEFTLNPTNCSRTSTASTLLGSGLDFASAIDDRPVTVSTPYQAADCAALGFKPALSLKLKGGTKRAGHPSLRATLKMKPGMANIARAQVTLPKSEFLDQSNIGTVCTRVQYVKDQCPAASIYGYAKAITPILDEPLEGPVYLRSSEHKLPDLVAGLKSGKIEIDLAGRIDSVNGQIRSTFESVPDAPVSKFTLTMQGGKKGLLENSTNLCAKAHKAIVEFDGQNGKISDSTPVVKVGCSKAKRKAAKRRNAR